MKKTILCCALLLCFSSVVVAQSYFPSISGNNSATGPFGAFTGLNQFSSGAILGPTTFAGLAAGNFASAANGTSVVVTDGTPGSPCTGSGTGALAVRLSGAWLCLPTTAGTSLSVQTDTTPNTSQSVLNFTDANGCTWSNPSAGVEEVNCGTGSSLTGSGTNNFLAKWTGTGSLGNSLLSQASITGGTAVDANIARLVFTNRNTGDGFGEIMCTSPCAGLLLEDDSSGGLLSSYVQPANGQVQIGAFDSSGVGGTWTFKNGPSKVMAYPNTTFANLGSSSAGFMVFCTDCTVASSPCTGSGGGAWAFANGSAWKCPF